MTTLNELNYKHWLGIGVAGIAIVCGAYFLGSLRPVGPGAAQDFSVSPGNGFRKVAQGLAEAGLVRSRTVFKAYLLATGSAGRLKPGLYRVSPASSTPAIVKQLVQGLNQEVVVTIPEGSSLFFVDKILSDARVLSAGALIKYSKTVTGSLEGRLFPDTYRFFINSEPAEVVNRLRGNFDIKIQPLLTQSASPEETLTLASLVEKEVAESSEQKIVAGILWKRFRAGMPLQVDATFCYLKQLQADMYVPCLPLERALFKSDSPYNTYLRKGLPAGPIGSPGAGAVQAALHPVASPYWFYLSDPKTGRTIFAKTLEEQTANRVRYLKL